MGRKVVAGASRVPPYHPDYRPPEEESSEDEYVLPMPGPGPQKRRGSEGYEVREINREQLLRQSIEDQVREPGRYNLYVPESVTPDETDSDTEVESEEPLAQRVEEWRARSSD